MLYKCHSQGQTNIDGSEVAANILGCYNHRKFHRQGMKNWPLNNALHLNRADEVLCDYLAGWDREGGREMQEGGDMGIYVYV